MSYVEALPIPALAPFVSVAWHQQVASHGVASEQLSIPTGGAELVWTRGAGLTIVGARTQPATHTLEPGTETAGLRLRPGATEALLGVPGAALVDETVDVNVVLGRAGARLADKVEAAADLVQVQQYLMNAVSDGPRVDPFVGALVERLGPWRNTAVRDLPDELFVSERQLRRRCQAATGLAPKALQRVLRFQGFVALVQAAIAQGRSPAERRVAWFATVTGYADQAHLARECRRLTGLGALEYVGNAACTCGDHDHSAAYAPVLRARPVV